MSSFSESIPRSNEVYSFLPAFHTLDGLSARRAMQSNALLIDDVCEVFGEKLAYLFYGRAAYKYAPPDMATKRLDLYPVCFAFDIELLPEIKRIFPFDSGAKHLGLLDKFINPRISLASFELEPETGRIRDIVLRFFGSNENYQRSRTLDVEIDPLNFEVSSYLDMASGGGMEVADERRATIEVQAGSAIPFSPGILKGIVCPIQYLDSPLFKAFKSQTKVQVRAYTIENWNPRYSFGLVAAEARRLIEGDAADG